MTDPARDDAGPTLSIGEVCAQTGLSRRTLQHYDREGIVPAGRDGAGRRSYRPPDVARLQLVRSLVSLGLPLKNIRDLVPTPGQGEHALLTRQLRVLELQELTVRTQRVVTQALVEALSTPGVALTPSALPALIATERASLGYGELERAMRAPDDADASPEEVERVLDSYLRWKAVSVRALLLVENGVPARSSAGLAVGRDWHRYLESVNATGAGQDGFEQGRGLRDTWPEPDRRLLERTEPFIEACHAAHLESLR